MSKASTVRSFRLRPNTLAALRAAAVERGTSPNALAEAALRKWLVAWMISQNGKAEGAEQRS